MYAYVVIVIVTHWLIFLSHSYFTIHPMHNCIRTLNLIFGLLAQVASRPSVQTHPYFIVQYVVPIPLSSLLYCKAILLLLLLLLFYYLAAMTYNQVCYFQINCLAG